MKTILVPVEPHRHIQSTLGTACLLAKAFGSYIEGFALRPAFIAPLGMEPASAVIIHDPDFDDRAHMEEAKAEFAAHMAANAVPFTRGETPSGPLAAWREDAPAGDEFVGSYGRVFDVTVVGRPDGKSGGARIGTLESALFDSGRPVLIAPPDAPRQLGDAVAIAWNGSTETARAISFAMPLLSRARQVFVLAGEAADNLPGPSGRQVQQHLTRNGIEAELHAMGPGQIRSGDAILDRARDLGCGLLVKGAYTQSRLRQMIFGGATSSIIARTTLPVLMAH